MRGIPPRTRKKKHRRRLGEHTQRVVSVRHERYSLVRENDGGALLSPPQVDVTNREDRLHGFIPETTQRPHRPTQVTSSCVSPRSSFTATAVFSGVVAMLLETSQTQIRAAFHLAQKWSGRDKDPCAQQDPQYCGMCCLRLSVQ